MSWTHAMMTPQMLALKAGKEIDFEGLRLVKDDTPLEPGDLYLAGRNTGPYLLTCRMMRYEQNDGSYGSTPDTGTTFAIVHAAERAYPFNEYECVKVQSVA